MPSKPSGNEMGETVQPMMDRVTKARGSVFSDISKDEREAIMRRAKKELWTVTDR